VPVSLVEVLPEVVLPEAGFPVTELEQVLPLLAVVLLAPALVAE
jgi:hypothetical protein